MGTWNLRSFENELFRFAIYNLPQLCVQFKQFKTRKASRMHLFHIQGKCNIRCKKNPLIPCYLKAEPHSDLHPDEASCSFGLPCLVRANPDSLQSMFDISLEDNYNWGSFIVSLTSCEEVSHNWLVVKEGIREPPVSSQASVLYLCWLLSYVWQGSPPTAVLGTWVGKGQLQQRGILAASPSQQQSNCRGAHHRDDLVWKLTYFLPVNWKKRLENWRRRREGRGFSADNNGQMQVKEQPKNSHKSQHKIRQRDSDMKADVP